MKIKKICILIILIILILSLTGCSNNNENEQDLHAKVDSEMDYLDAELILILGKLNNISFSNYMVEEREVDLSSNASEKTASTSRENSQSSNSGGESSSSEGSSSEGDSSGGEGSSGDKSGGGSQNNQKINVTEMVTQSTLNINYDDVKWNEIASSLDTFYTSWNTIILDLYKLNINGEDITSFSSKLDELLLNIKNQDKVAALRSSAELYSYIPKYLNGYSNDNGFKDLANAKMHILNAYVGASIEDWTYSDSELALAEQSFTNLMKNAEFMSQKEYNVNKTYITLKELQTSNQYRDKTIFFLKYKNLIQEIDIL